MDLDTVGAIFFCAPLHLIPFPHRCRIRTQEVPELTAEVKLRFRFKLEAETGLEDFQVIGYTRAGYKPLTYEVTAIASCDSEGL